MQDQEAVRQTADRLRELLTEHLPYRDRWATSPGNHVDQGREISQARVADVIAHHLWDTGEVDDRDTELPRRLKDTVSRALAGTFLSHRTLGRFIGAFAMSDLHRSQLWALRSGGDPARVVVVPPPDALPEGESSALRYQTISLHEFHTVGPDGLPVEHRTVHVIRALELVRAYSYRFDTDAAAVEVIRGGTAGPVSRTSEPKVFAVEIVLNRPVQAGETASFEYRTVLNYASPPAREFRRACRRPVANVEMHVQFDEVMLPGAVWWAAWAGLDDPAPTDEEPVALEPDGSVHKYVESFEGIAGFRWEFPG
ncbi:hypothetical protein [Actinoplanes sp. N902-109]|uniref:hypothetical protein n=1 Tax=Actinoplanes sp. (strain N902-109) TaxID=649831 RepID=UPI0003295060|nr:hypothetical protein [Actinoplanes sp. N902-109]AGL15414.1 hypothetical protein L083_1904 [Actinoplanes sp. N902-109]